MEQQEIKSCNKMGFILSTDARKFIRVAKASRSKPLQGKARIYFCTLCEKHHITSMSKAKFKRLLKGEHYDR